MTGCGRPCTLLPHSPMGRRPFWPGRCLAQVAAAGGRQPMWRPLMLTAPRCAALRLQGGIGPALGLYYVLDRSELPYPTRTRPIISDLLHLASTSLEVRCAAWWWGGSAGRGGSWDQASRALAPSAPERACVAAWFRCSACRACTALSAGPFSAGLNPPPPPVHRPTDTPARPLLPRLLCALCRSRRC